MARLRVAPAVPEVAAPLAPTDVPPPPEGMSTEERETWLELAPQVSARGVYDPTLYTAFRMLVRAVSYALNLPADAPDTAEARAVQAAQAAMGRWGLSPKDRKHASKSDAGDGERRGKWRRR